MAKARIGHEGEARILESMGVDMVDESEVLTPADPFFHINKSDEHGNSLLTVSCQNGQMKVAQFRPDNVVKKLFLTDGLQVSWHRKIRSVAGLRSAINERRHWLTRLSRWCRSLIPSRIGSIGSC